MELTTVFVYQLFDCVLFMMSKIQKLNGTHNLHTCYVSSSSVVYDVKDTKIEWNSQLFCRCFINYFVVYDVKDTKIEWNSQLRLAESESTMVVYDVKDTKIEWNSQQ